MFDTILVPPSCRTLVVRSLDVVILGLTLVRALTARLYGYLLSNRIVPLIHPTIPPDPVGEGWLLGGCSYVAVAPGITRHRITVICPAASGERELNGTK